MKFEHFWLKPYNLTRTEDQFGRKYITPDGRVYQSVTTFLAQFGDHSYIDEWISRVGQEEANKVSKRATIRGTAFHEILENHLLNKQQIITNIVHAHQFSLFRSTASRINNIRAIEYYLYSDILKLAGAVDCVAEFDGVLSIVDFKTSNRPKTAEDIENYWLQTTIYSLMIEEMYGIKIENLVILISVDLEKPQVFQSNRRNHISKLSELIKLRNYNLKKPL